MAYQNAHHFKIDNLIQIDKSQKGESGVSQPITSLHSLNITTIIVEWEELKKIACLGGLHQSEECYDAPKCHLKMREAVIKDIMSWVDSKDPYKKIMWMNGPAGAGKSAIAQTVAERCHEENKLVASFFFSRTATMTGGDNGTKLVPTITCQLADIIPEAMKLIVNELEENKMLLSHSMEVQMQNLVINPLKNLHLNANTFDISHFPHLVISDGLDECRKPEIQSRILKMITGAVSNPLLHICFLIVSRPELEIRTTFSDPLVSSLCIPLVLDDKYDPDTDIETYL
ncbi:hypothetical protein BDQ17DRAFT_1245118 [Cyathus striatus]|nr:hypothetical protein BDQ17DRAFT_1245118 [Cyathus striatus]